MTQAASAADVADLSQPLLLNPSLRDNLAFTLEQAGAVSGMGRTTLYLAVRDGRLRARKFGRRTLVLKGDLAAFLDALPARHLAREG